jgi:hypothetical protein
MTPWVSAEKGQAKQKVAFLLSLMGLGKQATAGPFAQLREGAARGTPEARKSGAPDCDVGSADRDCAGSRQDVRSLSV